jgi:hypothetical protein
MHIRSRGFLFLCTSLPVFIPLCFAASAFAGTHLSYSVIGFSPDGRYAALEQSGMVDGVGLPDCSVEMYDLDTNKKIDLPAAAPSGAGSMVHTCAEARDAARNALGNYDIDSMRQGSRLTLQPQPDRSVPTDPSTQITNIDITLKKKSCRLKLYKKSDQGENRWGREMIQWNVGLACGNEIERMILPEKRSDFSVSIKEARIAGDRLVLFPSTTYQDFEEPGSSTGVIGIVINLAPDAGVKLDPESLGLSRPSHCTAGEQTLFACSTGSKVLSICASSEFTEISGYLQYRFGPKGAPELSWPPNADVSRKNIEIGQEWSARGIDSHIRFKKGSYHYIVFDGLGAGTESQSGVVVQKDGKKVATLLCKPGSVVNNLMAFIDKKYGLTWDEKKF